MKLKILIEVSFNLKTSNNQLHNHFQSFGALSENIVFTFNIILLFFSENFESGLVSCNNSFIVL